MTCVLVGSVTVAKLPNCVEPPASAFSQMGSDDTHLMAMHSRGWGRSQSACG